MNKDPLYQIQGKGKNIHERLHIDKERHILI